MNTSRAKLLIAVVLLAALAGCGTTLTKQTIPSTLDDVPRITPREVMDLVEDGEDIVIVDTRSLDLYEAQHIAGAISLPVTEIASRHAELPKDTLIVLYCT